MDQPDPSGSSYIVFTAETNADALDAMTCELARLAQTGAPNVTILMASPGGDVEAAIAIHNLIRAMPMRIRAHNFGSVDSAAILPFLGADDRSMSPNASFFFHPVFVRDGAPMTAARLKVAHDGIRDQQERLAKTVSERCSFESIDAVRAAYASERQYMADESKTLGIVHRVENITVPLGTPVSVIAFQRD